MILLLFNTFNNNIIGKLIKMHTKLKISRRLPSIIKRNMSNDILTNINKLCFAKYNVYIPEYKNEDKAKILANEFIDKTYHFDNNSKINITPLLKIHHINSEDFLTSLYNTLHDKYWRSLSLNNTYDYNSRMICEYMSKKENKPSYILKQNDFHIKKIYDIELNVKFRKEDRDQQIIDIQNFDSINGKDSVYNILLDILRIKLNDNIIGGYLSVYDPATINKISSVCKSINPDKASILMDTFILNTKHMNCDTVIDITRLMDIFNILPEEVLFKMIGSSKPFNMGIFDYKKSKNITSVSMAKQLLNETRCFDYYNGMRIKNNFRKDCTQGQTINMKSYNEGGNISFYNHIISLLNDKLYVV